ncbi:HAMP domain-containing histidine kinase [Neorhizobium lilium]|uniref:histidine kinase n=1 Tax=Neorhizobium lilium TaxID=2503024 RepID=A0A3S3VJZ3_9HYPH|nr:HAMP domain-containing sensor histidine kinase [Neorhizobium lilium]RWX76162.1 HAMP domain-containing histidine kinase [Neorhizobium lilium]
MAGSAVLFVDKTAARWLTRLGDNQAARAGDIALLRSLAFAGALAFLVVPLALSMVLTPALALPVGAALVVAFFLIVAALAFLPARLAQPAGQQLSQDLAFEACPGLSLMLDPHGLVEKIGGRDRLAFPILLRDGAGQALAELVHVSDRIALVQAVDLLRQGASGTVADIRIERPLSAAAGRQFLHVRLDLTAIRNAEGELAQIFGQARDWSEEEMLRAEAVSRTAEAHSAHEAKSRFLAAVSHELRTPLNAILGFSDVLAGEYFGRLANDRQREYVGLIRQSGAHLLSVVNTMLDMSKIETGRYELLTEPFAIAEAMETCRAMLDLSARDKGITLTTRASRTIGEVVADRRAIQQVLINLAGNAIKFTGPGGVVSIDASLQGDQLVISVSDTGIGIAQDKLALIGQPFMQVQNDYTRHYEGTGLGLSLVKGLVALHGGRFSIASRPGEGTVVTITLPADGSGVHCEPQDATGEMVEFPPRLKASHQRIMIDPQELTNERAEAKIA